MATAKTRTTDFSTLAKPSITDEWLFGANIALNEYVDILLTHDDNWQLSQGGDAGLLGNLTLECVGER